MHLDEVLVLWRLRHVRAGRRQIVKRARLPLAHGLDLLLRFHHWLVRLEGFDLGRAAVAGHAFIAGVDATNDKIFELFFVPEPGALAFELVLRSLLRLIDEDLHRHIAWHLLELFFMSLHLLVIDDAAPLRSFSLLLYLRGLLPLLALLLPLVLHLSHDNRFPLLRGHAFVFLVVALDLFQLELCLSLHLHEVVGVGLLLRDHDLDEVKLLRLAHLRLLLHGRFLTLLDQHVIALFKETGIDLLHKGALTLAGGGRRPRIVDLHLIRAVELQSFLASLQRGDADFLDRLVLHVLVVQQLVVLVPGTGRIVVHIADVLRF